MSQSCQDTINPTNNDPMLAYMKLMIKSQVDFLRASLDFDRNNTPSQNYVNAEIRRIRFMEHMFAPPPIPRGSTDPGCVLRNPYSYTRDKFEIWLYGSIILGCLTLLGCIIMASIILL